MVRDLAGSVRRLALAAALVGLTSAGARGQFMGYGGFGYGYPAYDYGGLDYGGVYPGYGYGGMGYGGMGYGGMGYGGIGGFGFGGFGWGGYPVPTGIYGTGYSGIYPAAAYGGFGPGVVNPLFGLGLSPLGVQSTLAETAIIRGSGVYVRRPAAVPTPTPVNVAPGYVVPR
jgi:hypothetical protein